MYVKNTQKIQQLQHANTDTKLIKYLHKVSIITVMTVPSAFLSFEKKFNKYLFFYNIPIQLPCTFRLSFALIKWFFTESCTMTQPNRAKLFPTCSKYLSI